MNRPSLVINSCKTVCKMMLGVFVFLSLALYSDALTCTSCEDVACTTVGLPCQPPNYVYAPCGCCPKCPLELGQPCGSLTQRCQFDLWCFKSSGNKIEAYKNVPNFPSFKGCVPISTSLQTKTLQCQLRKKTLIT
ncbi:perlustrin-like [Haliotis rubra]|uniref:perlustrin-like n=1 Tax=Haliotis rubra TaxID=36100 RepID=UPI001EE507F7|nr:perlustrin-like [Haliotis rubra]